MIFWVSISICIIALGAQFKLRSFGLEEGEVGKLKKLCAGLFVLAVFAVFAYDFYLSFLQYKMWSVNEISKNLLSQKASVWGLQIDYFSYYAFMRFFTPSLLALVASGIFFAVARALNKKYDERFFYPEDFWLGALGIFLSGYPGFIFYFIFLLASFLVFQLITIIFSGDKDRRISLYYFWMPLSAVSLAVSNLWLSNLGAWKLLKI